MDDLISRQDAVKSMTNAIWHYPNEMYAQLNSYEMAEALAKDGLMFIPSAQQWIPCEKKMPKAEEKVWIQTQSGKVCFAMYEDGTILENDSNWSWYDIDYDSWDDEEDCGVIPEGWWEFTQFHPDCEFDCPVDEKVVAWMKLPLPYKEDSNETD